ncbi:MAG TPA: molecular chaperone DnaK, partial [Candidatus Dormibacteraeota bacterium]|nr:molecular chaperone DnaK [Candidatus Dormibacteraeota bacterium]
AKKAIEGGNKAEMDSARERLTTASHKLAEQMYKATQAAPGAGPGAGPADGAGAAPGSNGAAGGEHKKDEGVIDAEYVDVEDKK